MTDFETKLLELEDKKIKKMTDLDDSLMAVAGRLRDINDNLNEIDDSLMAIKDTIFDVGGSAEMGDALRAIADFGTSDYSYELNTMNDNLEKLLKIMKQED